jgi:uncharacterized protein
MSKQPTIDLQEADLKLVLQILQQYVPQYEVWAFGSRVKNTARKFSDLDLAIITNQPLSLTQLGKIQEAFSESDLSIKVDILDWSRISEEFKKNIQEKYVVLKTKS